MKTLLRSRWLLGVLAATILSLGLSTSAMAGDRDHGRDYGRRDYGHRDYGRCYEGYRSCHDGYRSYYRGGYYYGAPVYYAPYPVYYYSAPVVVVRRPSWGFYVGW